MELDLTPVREPALRFDSDDAAFARAPARRFDIADAAQKSFFSHGVFAVLAMGFGSYFGSLRDTLNPAPRAAADDARHGAVQDASSGEATAEVRNDDVDLADLSSFWQRFIEQYDDILPAAGRPRLQHKVLRYDFGDVQISYPAPQIGHLPIQFQSIGGSIEFRFPPVRIAIPTRGLFVPSDGSVPASSGTGTAGPTGNTPKPGGPGSTLPEKTNRAPQSRSPVSLGVGLANLSILLTWAELAKAAVDPDGDPLTLSNIRATSGTVRAYGDHAWVFTPEHDRTGVVSFTYTLSDGKASVQGQAYVRLVDYGPHDMDGTAGDDIVIGTPGNDIVDAHDGNDMVYGREGDDLISGGNGDDLLIGGERNDVIDGGAGNDRIFGGDGADILSGGSGDDRMFGEAGNDRLMGGDGTDLLLGGDGDDHLLGDDGHDVISGDAGDDLLAGGEGNDMLAGGFGADVVLGDSGNDTFLAGTCPALEPFAGETDPPFSVADTPLSSADIVQASDGNDVVNGGEGADCYDASAITTSVIIDLMDAYAEGTAIGHDSLVSVENAIGGTGDDTLVAGVMVNILDGGAGQDVFVFENVESLLNLGRGYDEIRRFEVGDKIDFSELSKELGRFYFADDNRPDTGSTSGEHFALVRFYQDLSSDDQDRQLVHIVTDIDGDDECELVVFSHHGLTYDDFILTGGDGLGPIDTLMA
jgi:hypothetical protein